MTGIQIGWYTDAFWCDWYTGGLVYLYADIQVDWYTGIHEILSLCYKLNFVHILCHNPLTLFITLP